MGFFAEFNRWLNSILATYIGDNLARVAGALEPAIVTLATVYVMVWGFLQLTGKIDEPFVTGLKKIITLVVVLGVCLRLWLYNTTIVDTFFNAPGQLAAAVIGAYDPVNIVDDIIYAGGDAATRLFAKGGVFRGHFTYYLGGFAVYVIVELTAIYTIFLFALSRIALSVLLALGPFFIALLFFESTKRYFEAWLTQLANYALITILTVMVAALMLTLIRVATDQALTAGGGIELAHAVRVCMAAGLTFLVMRQVMPIASGLASGVALNGFGVVSSTLGWALGGAARSSRQFTRGLIMDRETTRWDPLSRKAGHYTRQALGWGKGRIARSFKVNRIEADRPRGAVQ
jgi:type IV secretion system protein VirB6